MAFVDATRRPAGAGRAIAPWGVNVVQPLYQQIAEDLEARIRSGQLPAD
jgi:hypothetical protein